MLRVFKVTLGPPSTAFPHPSLCNFDDEFRFGISGYQWDRMGYRYGGYHTRRLKKEKEEMKAKGAAATADLLIHLLLPPVLLAPWMKLLGDRGAQKQQRAGDMVEVGGAEKGREGFGMGPDKRDVSQTRST